MIIHPTNDHHSAAKSNIQFEKTFQVADHNARDDIGG